mgnify:CR=1 FL=1
MQRIAAIVVTYNRIKLLKQCIEHLQMQTYPCDILIVNNASTDETEQVVEEMIDRFPNIKYRNTGANIGGAGGFNFGMKWAIQDGYDYLWVMDDDCLPKEDALEKLVEADKILKGNYGWLASAVFWKDGRECKMNRPKLKKSFYDYLEYMKYGIVQAEQATFVSVFFKSEIVEKVGLPIKDFFIWGDDIEYTRRISVRNNLPCFIVGKSQVVHAMKENNGSNIATDVSERIDRYKYAFRNEGYLYRQEGWHGIAYYFAKCAWNFLKILLHAPNKKLRRSVVLWGSVFKGLVFSPKIDYIR